ncbi:MAG: hypothetical protein V1876_04485 [Candidatus Peregrinibacteria bacterium]
MGNHGVVPSGARNEAGWLALADDFRKANWVELVKYPELVMQDLERFLWPLAA